MDPKDMCAAQCTCLLLLHGILHHSKRTAHDRQGLCPKGEQYIGYTMLQHGRQKVRQGLYILLGVKALPAMAVKIYKAGRQDLGFKISRTAAGNGSDPAVFNRYGLMRQKSTANQKLFGKNFHSRTVLLRR